MANTIDEIDPPLSEKLEHSSRFLLAARLLLEIFLVVSSSKDVINEYDEADVILAEDDEPTSVEMHRRVALSRKGKVDHDCSRYLHACRWKWWAFAITVESFRIWQILVS